MFDKQKKSVKRSIRAAFMNLAYKKTPTKTGTWTTDPLGLANLTDEHHLTHLTTDGVTTTTNDVTINVDLDQVFEVYKIDILNITGTGIKTNHALSEGSVKLQTSLDGTNWTTLDTQTVESTTFVNMAVNYEGEGIAVRHVRLFLENDGTYYMTIDIADIEVYGS